MKGAGHIIVITHFLVECIDTHTQGIIICINENYPLSNGITPINEKKEMKFVDSYSHTTRGKAVVVVVVVDNCFSVYK